MTPHLWLSSPGSVPSCVCLCFKCLYFCCALFLWSTFIFIRKHNEEGGAGCDGGYEDAISDDCDEDLHVCQCCWSVWSDCMRLLLLSSVVSLKKSATCVFFFMLTIFFFVFPVFSTWNCCMHEKQVMGKNKLKPAVSWLSAVPCCAGAPNFYSMTRPQQQLPQQQVVGGSLPYRRSSSGPTHSQSQFNGGLPFTQSQGMYAFCSVKQFQDFLHLFI